MVLVVLFTPLIRLAFKLKLLDGPKFMEPVVGIYIYIYIYIYAPSIANNVVLWKWNRVVEGKIS